MLFQSVFCLFSAASIFGFCIFAMGYIDTSALYHIIRAQSVIKLYVIYNMLEVTCYIADLHYNCVLLSTACSQGLCYIIDVPFICGEPDNATIYTPLFISLFM